MSRAPEMSVVVVVYDMQREAPRTLESLSPGFQKGIDPADYEVIVVDNGSPVPLGEAAVRRYGENFRYIYIEKASPSPAAAVNRGVASSSGNFVGIFIDGARIASPGILASAMTARAIHPNPVVATFGWHLGPDQQQVSISRGYDKDEEDRLLASIGWPRCGYRLFDISVFGGSFRYGLFFPKLAESNAIFARRETFLAAGGFDERFVSPGGGLANFDFFKRVAEFKGTALIIPLSEGTFHQLHGGISTNVSVEENRERLRRWFDEYQVIKGEAWAAPAVPVLYLGPLRPEASKHIEDSLRMAREEYAWMAGQDA